MGKYEAMGFWDPERKACRMVGLFVDRILGKHLNNEEAEEDSH